MSAPGGPPVGGARPLVIAHRGASAYRPENTLPAYELAIEQRADMIEIDLHRSRDGAIVIRHDEEVEAGGASEIGAATLAELRSLDVGGGQRMPTLPEVLDRFGAEIPFNLELKRGSADDYPGLETASLREVEARGLLSRTLFSSFYDPVLRRLREHSPGVRIGLLVSVKWPARALERARAVGAEALHPELPLVDRQLVEAAHGEGLCVYAFTLDSRRDMQRLIELGVDGFFTNHPDRARLVIDAA